LALVPHPIAGNLLGGESTIHHLRGRLEELSRSQVGERYPSAANYGTSRREAQPS
jgi:hypothetical protein